MSTVRFVLAFPAWLLVQQRLNRDHWANLWSVADGMRPIAATLDRAPASGVRLDCRQVSCTLDGIDQA
jgi:hypothetical protein